MLAALSAGFGLISGTVLLCWSIYATCVTKGFGLRAIPTSVRFAANSNKSGKSASFRAFATSLGGTIGVGNITGVSLAVAYGGAGAVFWIWVSALLCTTVKFGEIRLAIRFQPKDERTYPVAPMEYLRAATESKGYAKCFAIVTAAAAVAMGNSVQAKSAIEAAHSTFSIPQAIVAALFTLGTVWVLFGGNERIGIVAGIAVPILGGIFLTLGIAVILRNIARIPSAFRRIFEEAFTFRSVTGGILGSGAANAFRYGIGNGLFSHEAGLGSAGLAHACASRDRNRQALWGIFEVFVDSIVVSSVSALAILTSGREVSDGFAVQTAVFDAFGPIGAALLVATLIAFAFLSAIAWGGYGETCFIYIFGKRNRMLFRLLYALAPLFSLFIAEKDLWETASVFNGILLILNVTALIALRDDLRPLARLSPKTLLKTNRPTEPDEPKI